MWESEIEKHNWSKCSSDFTLHAHSHALSIGLKANIPPVQPTFKAFVSKFYSARLLKIYMDIDCVKEMKEMKPGYEICES